MTSVSYTHLYLILKEHFTRGQLIGNLIIIAGVLVYTL